MVDQGGRVVCSQTCSRVNSSWGHWPNPVPPCVPCIHTWPLPLFGVMFAASASSSLISELFYLKHCSVVKGTQGYLVEGINFIFSFLFFQPSICLVLLTLCPGTVEYCLLLYCPEVLCDPWMSFLLPFPPFPCSVPQTGHILGRVLCLKIIKNFKMAVVEY